MVEIGRLRLWLFGAPQIVILFSNGQEKKFTLEGNCNADAMYLLSLLNADIDHQRDMLKARARFEKATKDAQEKWRVDVGIDEPEGEGE